VKKLPSPPDSRGHARPSHAPGGASRSAPRPIEAVDFDAPRADLLPRLVARAEGAAQRLARLGVHVDVRAEEAPQARRGARRRSEGLGVALVRDGGERAELERACERARERSPAADVTIALRIDAHRIEVAIELPHDAGIDMKSLTVHLAHAESAAELANAFAALPDTFEIGVLHDAGNDDGARSPAHTFPIDELRGLLERDAGLWIGWSIPRDVALEHAQILDDQLEDALVALGPLYRKIAWSPTHDAVFHHGAHRERARKRKAEALRTTAGPRPTLRRPMIIDVDPKLPIEKGTRVRVLAGPFDGKEGVVQELDGRGGARVMLGLFSTRIDVKDLIGTSEGRDRPRLSSSHRKPLIVR